MIEFESSSYSTKEGEFASLVVTKAGRNAKPVMVLASVESQSATSKGLADAKLNYEIYTCMLYCKPISPSESRVTCCIGTDMTMHYKPKLHQSPMKIARDLQNVYTTLCSSNCEHAIHACKLSLKTTFRIWSYSIRNHS